ncbi:hypothetical protein SAFG77S_12474 [Streptomyces afghaniensis]
MVGEAGDTGADHLGAGEPRPQLDVFLREVGLHGPDDVVEPLLCRQVLGEAAQRDHRRVRVTVDQTGQGDLAAGVEALGGGQVRGPGGGRHGLDDPVPYDDRGVLLEPDALLIVVHEDGTCADDEVRGTVRGGRRHRANVRPVGF